MDEVLPNIVHEMPLLQGPSPDPLEYRNIRGFADAVVLLRALLVLLQRHMKCGQRQLENGNLANGDEFETSE
jgi:hypothetical protein